MFWSLSVEVVVARTIRKDWCFTVWRYAFLGCCLLFVPLSWAEEERGLIKEEYWSVQLENDLFAQSGDRYYTHGTELSRTLVKAPPLWLEDVVALFQVFESDGSFQAINYRIGQKIFTPDDLSATTLIEDDRPYAGYLYFNVGLLSKISTQGRRDAGNLLEFTVGVVGPASGAQKAQSIIHSLTGSEEPNGWKYQLDNEPVLGLSYVRFLRSITPLYKGLEYGVRPHLNVALGNAYSYLSIGLMNRFGTYLVNDLAPPNIRPGFPGLSLFRIGKRNNWYLFSGVEGRLVARNIFLDGNSFKDSHRVDRELFVLEAQFGAAFQVGGVRLSVSYMIRSKEFEEQKKHESFGAFNLSFSH